jgi:hypothetical protein
MTYRVVRYSTGEVFAAFAEHVQAFAAARDLWELHHEPFVVRPALQYDDELFILTNNRLQRSQ